MGGRDWFLLRMSKRTVAAVLAMAAVAWFVPLPAGAVDCRPVASGIEICRWTTRVRPPVGKPEITVLRIDPHRWILEYAGTGTMGEPYGYTARTWCRRLGYTACINAGMFEADGRTHVGYLRDEDHVNNGRLNKYLSVAAYGPKGEKTPAAPFRIFDLDDPGVKWSEIRRNYRLVVQNLRLIKRPGRNRWPRGRRRWSEAALGEDRRGNILFIFSQALYTMNEFNRELLDSGLGIVAAQHLEGGAEAQLYLHAGDVELHMWGRHGTDFGKDDARRGPFPIPNILGIRPVNLQPPAHRGTSRGKGGIAFIIPASWIARIFGRPVKVPAG